MSHKKFILSYILIFLISICIIGIFNYNVIRENVIEYMPTTWGEPVDISSGDITRDFAVIYTENTYIVAHIDNLDLVILSVNDLGEKLQEKRVALDGKFIKNIELIDEEGQLYLTYNIRAKGTDSFRIIELDKELNLSEERRVEGVTLSAHLDGTLYAIERDNKIEIIDISNGNIVPAIDDIAVSEMKGITVNDKKIIVYGEESFRYGYFTYDNGKINQQEIMYLGNNMLLTFENLRVTEDKGDLIIVLDHLSKNNSIGNYVYRYNFAKNEVVKIIGLEESMGSVGKYVEVPEIVVNHPTIKIVGRVNRKIGMETKSEDLVGVGFDEDGNLVEEGVINAYSSYYKHGEMCNEAIFYIKFNSYSEKSIRMSSQNPEFIKLGTDNYDYENSVISGIFLDKLLLSIVLILFVCVFLGATYALALGIHFLICSRNFDRYEYPMLIIILALSCLSKILVFYKIFYSSATTNRHLPVIFQNFWMAVLVNIIISGIFALGNIYYYKKNNKEISYGEIFLLLMIDGFISLFLFYPTIF